MQLVPGYISALANDQLQKLKRFPSAAEALAASGEYAGATLKKLRWGSAR
jgi:ATP-dependent helicase YprA (DUF1998 family)